MPNLQNRKISVFHKLTMIFCCCVLSHSASAHTTQQGPIVIDDNYVATNGNIITGSFLGTLTSPAITVTTTKPITIMNSTVTGPWNLIYMGVPGTNVQVVGTTGISTNPNVVNVQKGSFVNVHNPGSLFVSNCTDTGSAYGVYVNEYTGNFTHTQTIIIKYNQFYNIDGRPSNGNGGYVTSGDYSTHAVFIQQIQGIPDMEIAWNQVINVPRQSQSGSMISITESSGTTDSHMRIHDNYLQGAYATNPGVDTYNGGGIIMAGGTSDTTATATSFVDVFSNQIVSTSNYGLEIAAGHDNTIYNNRVVSSGFLSDGTYIAGATAHGLNNWNEYNQAATVFFNNNVENNNPVGLVRKSSTGALEREDWWLPGQTTSENNVSFSPVVATSPTVADEANEYTIWQQKLRANNIKIGAKD